MQTRMPLLEKVTGCKNDLAQMDAFHKSITSTTEAEVSAEDDQET
jgi:hypothetical protein